MVGLADLKALLQPKQFCHSVIFGHFLIGCAKFPGTPLMKGTARSRSSFLKSIPLVFYTPNHWVDNFWTFPDGQPSPDTVVSDIPIRPTSWHCHRPVQLAWVSPCGNNLLYWFFQFFQRLQERIPFLQNKVKVSNWCSLPLHFSINCSESKWLSTCSLMPSPAESCCGLI